MTGSNRMKICSVILAGGHSTRMGANKALLPLGNRSVIAYIVDEMHTISNRVVINCNDSATYSHLRLPVITDNYYDQGPLAGIEAVMSQIDADIFLFSACDTPFINRQVYLYLLKQLAEHDAVVPIYQDKLHPLSGIYRKKIVPKLQTQLDKEERKVRLLFNHINVKYVDAFPNIPVEILEKHFFNMNNPLQYKEAKQL